MKVKNLWKLVRDGVIKRIREKNESENYRRATDAEFRIFLARKLVEEAGEVLHAVEHATGREKIVAETADLQEVLQKFLEVQRIPTVEVMEAQICKRREVGSFDGQWLLNTL